MRLGHRRFLVETLSHPRQTGASLNGPPVDTVIVVGDAGSRRVKGADRHGSLATCSYPAPTATCTFTVRSPELTAHSSSGLSCRARVTGVSGSSAGTARLATAACSRSSLTSRRFSEVRTRPRMDGGSLSLGVR